jgi:polyferredoxin
MTIAIFLAILFGPVLCGWLCPLGTIQEWFGKLGRKIFKKKYNNVIPYKYDKYLRYLRYVILVWVVYVTAVTGKLVFQEYDPYFALFNFWSSEVAVGSLIILGVTLAMSLIIERPWCKYACPLGALTGISNLFRVFKVKRNASTCISCGACDRACPMNISISDSDAVLNHQCISCMKCTSEEACPIGNTIEFISSSKVKGDSLNEN